MSDTELEVKFVAHRSALSLWSETLKQQLSKIGFTVFDEKQQSLLNTYFDTADHSFETHKIGMRVRGCDGRFEQTIKTQRAVKGGLHERKEYNEVLPDERPNLTLFPQEVWQSLKLAVPATSELVAQFSTHFTRRTIHLQHEKGECELVFDEGEIRTEKAVQTLNEIEIELVKGEPVLLLKIAALLATKDVRLSDTSKAAQGYELLQGIQKRVKPLANHLSLHENVATETVFCLGCETAMAHWQHHEHSFFATDSAKVLPEIQTALRLLLQSLSLFLPVLQCQPLLDLQRNVLAFSEKWIWVDELQSTRFLLSKKGPFHKTLSRQGAVMSYFKGRQTGLISAHDPKALLCSVQANSIKLAVVELLLTKPWRNNTVGAEQPVIDHARGWLSQGWQTLQQSLQSSQPMQAINYTSVETTLRQTLFNGFLLSNLFSQSASVRAPWLDLLVGVDEIRALLLLKQALHKADLEFADGLTEWVDEKLHHLLQIMERTRQVAMNKETYW